jgi:hypothetical protein
MDATPTPAQLTQAIEAMVRTYLSDGRAASAYELNDGHCEDFATEVADALGGESERLEGTWADNLTVDGAGYAWDVGLIEGTWPACRPTHGLDWDDAAAGIPAHSWLVLDGRHYDAECPEGVDNLFELPLIRRIMERLADTRQRPHPGM